MSEKRPAPHRLDLVIDFVNTADLEDRRGRALRPRRARLLAGRARPARRRRDARHRSSSPPRSSCAKRCGGRCSPTTAAPPTARPRERLEATARRGELSVRFGDGGGAARALRRRARRARWRRCSRRSPRRCPTGPGRASRPAAPTPATGRSTTSRATAPGPGATWPSAGTAKRSAPTASARPREASGRAA